MSMTDDVRTYLAGYPGQNVPAVANALGLTNKQASSVLSRLVKNGEVTKSVDGFSLAATADDDLIGDIPTDNPFSEQPEPVADEDVDKAAEPLFYESIDFPGNYSIVMAPFAVEIAEAAKVPAKVETFPGKLVRRVHFGGPDMDAAKAVRELVEAEALAAHEELKVWQKKHLEERRGLTDMQKYLQHREQLANFGHKVARRVKKGGGIS